MTKTKQPAGSVTQSSVTTNNATGSLAAGALNPAAGTADLASVAPRVAEATAQQPQIALAQRPASRRPEPMLIPVSGALGWAKVDARDYDRVRRINWCTNKSNGAVCGCNRKGIGGNGRMIFLHVFIKGRKPGFVIDHIDGDRRNCTRANLRHVLPAINAYNKPGISSRAMSGIRGVNRYGDKWYLKFTIRHRNLGMGVHDTLDQARWAANIAIGLIYGRGTRLTDNQPFARGQLRRIVSQARGISTDNLRRILSKTWDLGDDLSAELRRRLKERYLREM